VNKPCVPDVEHGREKQRSERDRHDPEEFRNQAHQAAFAVLSLAFV
jgi:hypothetical protein